MYRCIILSMTTEVPVTEARAQFSELISRVGYGGERIVITRHGRPLVALIAASDLTNFGAPDGRGSDLVVLDLGSRHEDQGRSTDVAARNNADPTS